MEKIKDLLQRLNNSISKAVKEFPGINIYYWKRKIGIYSRRTIRSIRRFFRKRPIRAVRELAYNVDINNLINFFSPQLCYILTTKTKKRRANMSPVKWLSIISFSPPLIMMALFKGKAACINIKKYNSFSLSMIGREYISDYNRLINIGKDEVVNAISRFRSSPAFFINGYIVKGFPWVECRLEKIININRETSIVVGRILHISKIQLILKDKLLHFIGDNFLDPKRLNIIKLSRKKK